MKTRIYLRIARGSRGKSRVMASVSPKIEPIKSGSGYSVEYLPTVYFAVDFNIPNDLFEQAQIPIAEINVAMKDAKVAGEILVPAIKKALEESKNPSGS